MQNKLAELRKEKNMNQAEFGKLFNLAQNTISQWEQGKRSIDTGSLVKIADHFQVSTDYLLGRSEFPSLQDFRLSLSEEVLIKKYRTLSELSRDTLDTVLESLYIKDQQPSQKNNTA